MDKKEETAMNASTMPFIPEDSDEKSVHVIRFSRNKNEGHYGFLNEVYNPEDQ